MSANQSGKKKKKKSHNTPDKNPATKQTSLSNLLGSASEGDKEPRLRRCGQLTQTGQGNSHHSLPGWAEGTVVAGGGNGPI